MKSSNLWGRIAIVLVVLVSVILCCLCFAQTALAACPSADLTGDCFVDFNDFALIAAQWPATDYNDVAAMANQWLDELAPDPCDMVWVYINDTGEGMKDDPGNPISHGGFTGYMSKYETTNAQYCEYLNSAMKAGLITVYSNDVYAVSGTSHNQIYFELYPGSSPYPYSQITYSGGVFNVRSRDGYSMANHPVVVVSWYGATAFCNYYGYRLPTEWEWQAVADHYGEFTYGCGTTINHTKANYDMDNPLNLSSYSYTSPVDYYSSYGYGMNDMAGNVWEWTSSCYYADCDPGSRVLRGGGWYINDFDCRVSNRTYSTPDFTHINHGFRVCR